MASYTRLSASWKLLFRQLFEKDSSSYTYLRSDISNSDKPTLLIDPVEKTVDRDVSLIKELGGTDARLFHENPHVRATLGHTLGCVTYVTGDRPDQPQPRMVFSGDALLIRSCGRTNLPGGSSENLYKLVHSQIFTLPRGTLLYPAHDNKRFTVSTVGEEILYNPRFTKDEVSHYINDFHCMQIEKNPFESSITF